MTRRDWILAALMVAWFWQLERWHELNKRAAVLKAETEVVSEICQSVAREIKALRP